MRGIPRARSGFDTRHDKRWCHIGLLARNLRSKGRDANAKTMTNLVARVDDDVSPAKEAGDSGRMHMEQPLLRFGNTVTTPVDLHELR